MYYDNNNFPLTLKDMSPKHVIDLTGSFHSWNYKLCSLKENEVSAINVNQVF